MLKEEIIHEIYDKIPKALKGINGEGEHVICLDEKPFNLYATLEKLPIETLTWIAEKFGVHASLLV